MKALIKPCATIKEAVTDSELVFEAIVENLECKRNVFAGECACS